MTFQVEEFFMVVQRGLIVVNINFHNENDIHNICETNDSIDLDFICFRGVKMKVMHQIHFKHYVNIKLNGSNGASTSRYVYIFYHYKKVLLH